MHSERRHRAVALRPFVGNISSAMLTLSPEIY